VKQIIVICCLVTSYLVIESCAKNPVSGKSQVVFSSEAQEIAKGKEADHQIIDQYGLYTDSALQQFVDEKGKQMAAISHRPNLEYHFRLVDSEALNAFAVPGGYIYFTRGIMAYFNSEAEFAGVLGHEMAHITARHSVIQQRNRILGQIGVIATAIINPDLAGVASSGLGLLFLKFNRNDERQSDELGVEYSSKLGYDAQQMANFFKRMQTQEAYGRPDRLPPFLSTHPDPGNRQLTTSKVAAEWQTKLSLEKVDVKRNEYLRLIDGMVYGEDPRRGFFEKGVYYHPGLKIQFVVPVGWRYQNTPHQVQLMTNENALMLFMPTNATTLEDAADSAMQRYKFKTIESTHTKVGGYPALSVTATRSGGMGSIRSLSYFIQYNQSIYHFFGTSPANNFDRYSFHFRKIAESFQRLVNPSKLNKKTERIGIRAATSTNTLGQILSEHNMPQARLEELALLNGMKLTDNVTKGTLIKIIAQ
jgi:predicted Zn-dependent protease